MSTHVRQHGSLLAPAEKRLLLWIAARLPRAIHSDHLTMAALAAMALAGGGFALARWDVRSLWLVIAGLVLNWFGDSLDGTLARVRHEERPRYGFYVDHVVDIVGSTLLFAGLGASGFMTPAVALAVLVGYLLLSAEAYLTTAVQQIFVMSFAWVGPTELRLLLAAGALALFGDPHVSVGPWRAALFDVGGVIACVGMGVALVTTAVRHTRALSRLEPARRQAASPVTATSAQIKDAVA